MGTVFRKTATKPLPLDAETISRKGKQIARWKDRNGKSRTAPVTTGRDGSPRIVVMARTFTAKFRDGENRIVEKATGCRDETASRQVLAQMERQPNGYGPIS